MCCQSWQPCGLRRLPTTRQFTHRLGATTSDIISSYACLHHSRQAILPDMLNLYDLRSGSGLIALPIVGDRCFESCPELFHPHIGVFLLAFTGRARPSAVFSPSSVSQGDENILYPYPPFRCVSPSSSSPNLGFTATHFTGDVLFTNSSIIEGHHPSIRVSEEWD